METEKMNFGEQNANPWTAEGLFDGVEFAGSGATRPTNTANEAVDGATGAINVGAKGANLELPNTSRDMACRFYLHEIERSGKMPEVADFISKKLGFEQKIYSGITEFDTTNPGYAEGVDAALTSAEKTAVKEYSGYRFAWINSVMRGFWDYDKLGRKTPEAEAEIRETADKISDAIAKAPEMTEDFVTFRGTNLDSFRAYGIENANDLSEMQGQFMLEQGFTSTSLTRENSFVGRDFSDNALRNATDIEMRYHVPGGTHAALGLFDADLSYSPEQTEVLLNRDTLSYISRVSTAEDGHTVVDAVVVPAEIYDNHN